jgi:zinc transport system permease protein
LVVIFYFVFHKQIFAIIYNDSEAKVGGVKVGLLNFVQSLLFSIVIAISAKTIGSLVVSSLIAIPVAASLQAKTSYRGTLLLAIALSVVSVIIGITIAYYASWTPGATIAIVAVSLLVLMFLYRALRDAIAKRRSLKTTK